jgi:hypothetical protein
MRVDSMREDWEKVEREPSSSMIKESDNEEGDVGVSRPFNVEVSCAFMITGIKLMKM